MTERLGSAIRSTITRATITNAQVGPRTILQVQMLANEDTQTVELLLPPGRSANPAVGTDLVVLQITGTRDHLVALGGDLLGQAITDLASGEFGDQDARNQRIAYRTTMLEIVTPLELVITSPVITVQAAATGDAPVTFKMPLPTSDPHMVGEWWQDGDTISVSTG